MKRYKQFLAVSGLLMLMLALMPQRVQAHQPYCEFGDTTATSPWQVPDSTISYAYYADLYPAGDIDYFTFDAEAGQSVLISMSIPDIEGQEDFAPVMVLYGEGVEGEVDEALPTGIEIPNGQGSMMVDLGDEPNYWYEPFGGRYYWNWEDTFFEAPEDGSYTVALWHPEDELGRYSFVVGEEEIRGGDMDCSASFDDYWTPLVAGENPYRDTDVMGDAHKHEDGKAHDHEDSITHEDGMAHDHEDGMTHDHADGMAHNHGEPIELNADGAPVVDLQVIPLSDGSYNVRIQTMNFIFAPHNVDMDPADGEGHAHLYVDDEKIARAYGEWYHIASLPEDAEMIYVALYANNHQPLVVDGKPISDMVLVSDLMTADDMASLQ